MEDLTILNFILIGAITLGLVVAIIIFISHKGEIQLSHKKISIKWEK